MVMFAIYNLKYTVHDTLARNAILSKTQIDHRPIVDSGSVVITGQKSVESIIQML